MHNPMHAVPEPSALPHDPAPRRLRGASPAPRAWRTEATTALAVQLNRAERRVTIVGELDFTTVSVLAAVMSSLFDGDPGDCTIDIGGLSFIDAAGIGCVVGFANQHAACDSRMSVVSASPRVRRVFDLVQLAGMLQQP